MMDLRSPNEYMQINRSTMDRPTGAKAVWEGFIYTTILLEALLKRYTLFQNLSKYY